MRFALFAGSVLACVVSFEAAAQGWQDFTLVNGTGYTIEEVYVSPTKARDWEEDVLGDDILEDEDELEISFPKRVNTCRWDLMVVYDDQETAEWEGFNLCEISRIDLRYDRKSGRTWAHYE